MSKTTIAVTKELRDKIALYGRKNDSFEDILRKILSDLELSRKGMIQG